jgi:hypothetical protein
MMRDALRAVYFAIFAILFAPRRFGLSTAVCDRQKHGEEIHLILFKAAKQ